MSASVQVLKASFGASKTSREDYGDWQTSYGFAKYVCQYLKERGITPEVIVEPTCGVGNFIVAAVDVFKSARKIYGIEINSEYIGETERKLKKLQLDRKIDCYELYNTSVFSFDFSEIAKANHDKNILVLGNPPWVTNSEMGKNDSDNLPVKSNVKRCRGIDAITGKGNFDIAESICYLMIDAFSPHARTNIALLVKNSVVKNIVHEQRLRPRHIQDIRQHCFDAKKEFDVSVSASLFECRIASESESQCRLFDFYTQKELHSFGWVGDAFVSNVQDYGETSIIDGQSPLVWRSGIKHDCSKVMELSLDGSTYSNGLKETVDVNEETVFPLLKSSDIGKGLKGVKKYLVLPQTSITEDTSTLKKRAPKTYTYLLSHAEYLDSRKSVIYKNKPRFCVFGLGRYSFAPYKIVISALYQDLEFSLVGPIAGKPVMVDDTCYLLGFDNPEYAWLTLCLLQSDILKHFIQNICFMDAKRVINRELLMRINLYQLSKTVDLSNNGIPNERIREYQNWLRRQTSISLFG